MFMILTYMVEFDKVHYPLSLTKVSAGTDKSHLLGVIDSLRKELAVYKSQGSNQKSIVNPMLDMSMSRSHAATHTFMGSGFDQNPILSPQTEHVKQHPTRYNMIPPEMAANLHSPAHYQSLDPTSIFEMGQQKAKLLQAKIEAQQQDFNSSFAKQQAEHAEEMRTILRHAQELEERLAFAEGEVEQWKTVAEQRRETGGREREKALQKEIEALKRKVNEATANEKLARAQLKEARETIDVERKKFGVAYKPARDIKDNGLEKASRLSPWKRPNSRSGRFC